MEITEAEANQDDGYYISNVLHEMLPAKLQWISPENRECGFWVFWSQEEVGLTNRRVIYSDSIKSGLIKRKLTAGSIDGILIQFWALKKIGGRHRLTTLHQPFAMDNIRLNDQLFSYRKQLQCLNYNFDVDMDNENQTGSNVGRVFQSRWPEYSPKVRCYSIKDFPQLDLALDCGVVKSLAVPVCKPLARQCVGVLEILLTSNGQHPEYRLYHLATSVLGAANMGYWDFPVKVDRQIEYDQSDEILEVLKRVCETHSLPFARTWAPSWDKAAMVIGCGPGRSSRDIRKELLYTCPEIYFHSDGIDWSSLCNFTDMYFPLRKGQGPVGMAHKFHKPCFCKDVTQLRVGDYPLGHFPHDYGFSGCFAICLRSIGTGGFDVVLEFFLSGDRTYCDPHTLLKLILATMKQLFRTFKVTLGKLGEEPFIEFGKSSIENKIDFFERGQTVTTQVESEALRNEGEVVQLELSDEQVSLEDVSMNGKDVTVLEQSKIVVASPKRKRIPKTPNKGSQKMEPPPCRAEQLQGYFGMKLEDAARSLDVSRSTLKRWCRFHSIKKWPFPKKSKVSHSSSNPTHVNDLGISNEERISEASRRDPSCSDPLPNQAPIVNDHQVPNFALVQDSSTVTVKAKYQARMIKFQLTFSSGMAELMEEVTKRLKLRDGSFEIEYQDEDNDYILIACEDDLSGCMHNLRSSGKTAIAARISTLPNMSENTGKKDKLEVEIKTEKDTVKKTVIGGVSEVHEKIEKVAPHPFFQGWAQKRAVEQYIFNEAGDQKQILVNFEDEFLYRSHIIESLAPMVWVRSNVINTVAAMLTREEERRHPKNPRWRRSWYLPTYVYEQLRFKSHTVESICCTYRRYMGDMAGCEKIFIPVNEKDHHWYLCLIDLKNGVIELLDSQPDYACIIPRVNEVSALRDWFAEMLGHIGGAEYGAKVRSLAIRCPEWVPRQDNGCDCGVFVIKFMREEYGPTSVFASSDKYDSVKERVNVAIDMVFHEANLQRENWEIILKQVQQATLSDELFIQKIK